MYLWEFFFNVYFVLFRICNLLNTLSKVTDESSFFHALWQCVLSSPDYRLPAVTVLLGRLNKKLSAADQVHCLGGSLPLVVSFSKESWGKGWF